MICEKCKTEIKTFDDVGCFANGQKTYSLFKDTFGIGYEEKEFLEEGDKGFFCRSCGETLKITEEQVEGLEEDE